MRTHVLDQQNSSGSCIGSDAFATRHAVLLACGRTSVQLIACAHGWLQVTHEPCFCLLREVVSYSGGGRGQPIREALENPGKEHFILFHIGY